MTVLKRLVVTVTIGVLSVVLSVAGATFDGYTFVYNGSNAWLYGMDKKVIKQWSGLPNNSACCADLLRDSSILWQASASGSGWTQVGALQGGRLMIKKWDGTVTWDYKYASASYMPHHDMEPVYYTNDPKEKPNVLVICYTAWGDKITELKPTGLNTAEVVWEWYASDHTCDANTGSDKPELLDKAKGGAGMGGIGGTTGRDFDRMHTNNVSFNRTLNQLVLSVKGYNEIMVIDHSTTTAQAKGTSGGRSGKGGSILYRWGMPANYGMSGTQQLKGQHGASWIQDTMLGSGLPIPGAFNMACVDNMNKRVVEVVPAGTKNGTYPRSAGTAFAPTSPLWTFAVSDMQGNEGTVQRLPNGNTIICTGGVGFGGTGRVFEINPAGAVQWDLTGIPQSAEGVRYAYGYLSSQVSVTVDATPDYTTRRTARIVANPLTGRVCLVSDAGHGDAWLSLFSMDGRELIAAAESTGSRGWDLGGQPGGQYVAVVNTGNDIVRERIIIGR